MDTKAEQHNCPRCGRSKPIDQWCTCTSRKEREQFDALIMQARGYRQSEKTRMKCPNCFRDATIEHLRESPDCASAVASLCALYRASKRTTPPKPGPGRGHKKPSL